MDKRRSFVMPPRSSGTLSRSVSSQSMRTMSTRMKKVAPPPPPLEKAPLPPLSNGSVAPRRSSSVEHRPLRPTPGEDCAFDEMLEGRMDLEVVLPDCKVVKMTVDRKTPMMDLLVHATTSNKISPSGHIINVISRDDRNVHYKPNTPIGSLDANTVYIIPKSTLDLPVKRMPKLANQPFEQTFRLQVNLPLNRRMVVRISPRCTLAELKSKICSEKELDLDNHHLVHPAQPDTVLDLSATLEVYGCAEISLMSTAGLRESIQNVTPSILVHHTGGEEEKKKKGILRIFSRKKKDVPSSDPPPSNGLNHVASSQSDSATLNSNRGSICYQPKQSLKRKPAPAPPPPRNCSPPPLSARSSNSLQSRPESEVSAKTADEADSSVSHSRHSSDSSGYHEPSVFSDCSESKSPEASLVVHDHQHECRAMEPPAGLRSAGSSVSVASTSRKRKAPQPPASNPLPPIESPSTSEAPPQNGRQESEALQYLEEVLQESERRKAADDSDSDSLKEEEEERVVCQAEVHADASDCESPDSVVEPRTVVAPLPDTSLAPLSNPGSSHSAGYEVVDTSADDSGISHSLNSDADSSVPSLNSDCKTMSDSGCHEDVYCNVTESTDLKLVPSDSEFPVECSTEEETETALQQDPLRIESDSVTECPLPDEQNSPQKNSLQKTGDFEKAPEASAEPVIKENPSDKESKPVERLGCDGSSSGSGSVLSSGAPTPQGKKKLDNFVLSSYKRDSITDIYSLPSNYSETSCLVAASEHNTTEVEVPRPRLKSSQPEVKIVPFEERSAEIRRLEDGGNRVQEKCVQLNKTSTLPLTGRCASMHNLGNQMRVQSPSKNEQAEPDLKDSVKRTQSDQNILNELQSMELRASFLQEQRRLQEEYQRLQSQFMSWQKQLMSNQSLLQDENILPLSSLPDLSTLEHSAKLAAEDPSRNKDANDLKMRSLPRPKTKPLTVKEPSRPKTPPIPTSPTEASVVDIDIGSQEVAKRPDSLTSCSVDTQANIDLKDKVTQIPSPQDKVIQVPSPQDKVTSGTQVPSPENVASKEDVSAQTSIQNLASPEASAENVDGKSQTLPRSKLKPVSAFQPSETMTLNRKPRPKAQAVAVTIGSWQQRQATIPDIESSNVASSRSKFKSLENIPQSSKPPAPINMEKRKLPPVPGEASETGEKLPAADRRKLSADVVRESAVPSGKQNSSEETAVKKVHDPVAQRQQRTEAKQAVQGGFRAAKPFVKLSSMKDESHPPSIIGLRKWPLSDISEAKDSSDEKTEDPRSSAKRPAGFVQDKVRRAEVDLRKPRSSRAKDVAATTPKEPVAEPRLHITVSARPAEVDKRQHSSAVTTPVTLPSNNTIPKSLSLNSELLAVFGRKARDGDRYKEVGPAAQKVNGSSQQPPPPPPPPPQPSAVMPAIPPAEQIPVSSRLVMAGETRATKREIKKNPTKISRTADPREELMLEIRGFGGKQALRKLVEKSCLNLLKKSPKKKAASEGSSHDK